MVTQAQEQVKTHAEDSSQQINVQKLIDKHTKEMAVSISLFSFNPFMPSWLFYPKSLDQSIFNRRGV